jgi:hypothetical protein
MVPADKGEHRMPETPGPEVSDPRKHAAELLDQADRLIQLAGELTREARLLNPALGVPPATELEEQAESPHQRRFAPSIERREEADPGLDRESDDLPISDGARLMITNLATLGTSREEILELMRDELGLKDAEAILDRMRI